MSRYSVSNGFITLRYGSENDADDAAKFLNSDIP